MAKSDLALQQTMDSLQERAKELNCLYEIGELLRRREMAFEEVLEAVARAIPAGWQYPEITAATIALDGQTFKSSEFGPTEWWISAEIEVQDQSVGQVKVYYLEDCPQADSGPFLREEVRLVQAIANRLSYFLLHHRVREMREAQESLDGGGWRSAIHLLRQTDQRLYLRIARKLLNHLVGLGVQDAVAMLRDADFWDVEESTGETNVPGRRRNPDQTILLQGRPFEIAAKHLSGQEILDRIHQWIIRDRINFLISAVEDLRTSLPDLADAVRRYYHVTSSGMELPKSTLRSLRAGLCRRVLTGQNDFIAVAKEHVRIKDFRDLLDKSIMHHESHGQLGGKASGLFLAQRVVERADSEALPIGEVLVPKTWYLVSDGQLSFIALNDLEDVIEQKYKEIDEVRQEYPNIVQLFKNSVFPSDLARGLSVALDDLGDVPLIVRSSSLLEDRVNTAFSGKYKSLFVANQGSKQERLGALIDAITEVYASVFGPDAIAYRRERGLLDFYEEMGVLIQEVVGVRLGRYYLPAFGGVAFSRNEFRWSPRIRREDGLVRLVPGLGTRAVDRVRDDYPVLVAPGQPKLRVNTSVDEIIRYAPRKIDVINLESNRLETVELSALLRECGDFPALERVFSVCKDGILGRPNPITVDPEKDELIATFHGFIDGGPFLAQVGHLLKLLEDKLGYPVDVEFAHDGSHFYLLQCRPQSSAPEDAAAPIPKDVQDHDVIFTARKYVSNGWLPEITHVVFVDPRKYSELGSREELLAVGKAVGRLNKLLPKRQFLLMGPGRWGSLGDIKLGVSVTYADISNAAMLVEIALKQGNYVPDLSFGTHFFQDLVESRIRYLPLYPDDPKVLFNWRFLTRSQSLLPEMLPEFAHLSEVLRVIDVPSTTDGRVLQVLLNAELEEGMAVLCDSGGPKPQASTREIACIRGADQFWRWRLQMAERIAREVDGERQGVVAMYVFGSTKNATAGPGSDIDLLVHFRGATDQRQELLSWLEGWSLCLDQMNFLRTGYRSGGLLDVHLVTDEDIEKRTSYAVKIGAITDPARELSLGRPDPK